MRRTVLLAAVVALALAACSDDEGGEPPPTASGCQEASGGRVTLVAEDLRWDTDCLRAGAGALTIEVDNRDDGQNHNVHLADAPGSPATALTEGPSRQKLDVELEPGSYEFVCDIHPNMVGTLTIG